MTRRWIWLVAAALACEPLANGFEDATEDAPIFRASHVRPPADPAPSKLRVVAWNIKFGGGRIDFFFDEWGDRVVMTVPEVLANMNRVAGLVREVDPDVLLVEECDVNGKRSAYVDQLRYLLENTNLGYGAYFSTWDSRYVAADGMGRIEEGVAVLSKYRIVEATRIGSVDRTDQDALTKEFYLHRAVGRAVLDLGSTRAAVFVVHTEAYDQDGTKQKQIAQVLDLARREALPFVVGGDFNELPPGRREDVGLPGRAPEREGHRLRAASLYPRGDASVLRRARPVHPARRLRHHRRDAAPVLLAHRRGTERDRSHGAAGLLEPDARLPVREPRHVVGGGPQRRPPDGRTSGHRERRPPSRWPRTTPPRSIRPAASRSACSIRSAGASPIASRSTRIRCSI